MEEIKNVGYHENEWCVMFVDENGDTQVKVFDLLEDAQWYFDSVACCRVGVMTSRFYNRYYANSVRGRVGHTRALEIATIAVNIIAQLDEDALDELELDDAEKQYFLSTDLD